MGEKLSKYAITNVTLWNVSGISEHVDVFVENGVVASIKPTGSAPDGWKLVDGSEQVLMPLGVDPQVHLRVPGQPEKETPLTGLTAAIAGGIGAVLTMPNTNPVIDQVDACNLARQELADAVAKTGVETYLSAAITMGQKGKTPVDFQALADWGIKAFTDDGVGVVEDSLMEAVYKASEETGIPVLQHAEVPGHKGVLAPGPFQEKEGIAPYPESAEVDMVVRDLTLLKKYPKARYHVLHVSSAKTLEAVNSARLNKLQATCEVSPHHLYFSSDDISADNRSFKMNPPLRSPQDRQALRTALREGVIDFVATDHAPHESSAKGTKFSTSAYGTTGLETSLRVLLSMQKKGELTPERVVDVFSATPAKFLGIDDQFGLIETGRTFRAVLVDVNEEAPVTEKDLYSLSKNSCFLGATLPGRIKGCFVGERQVFQN